MIGRILFTNMLLKWKRFYFLDFILFCKKKQQQKVLTKTGTKFFNKNESQGLIREKDGNTEFFFVGYSRTYVLNKKK